MGIYSHIVEEIMNSIAGFNELVFIHEIRRSNK
jgi:hypothetical protein